MEDKTATIELRNAQVVGVGDDGTGDALEIELNGRHGTLRIPCSRDAARWVGAHPLLARCRAMGRRAPLHLRRHQDRAGAGAMSVFAQAAANVERVPVSRVNDGRVPGGAGALLSVRAHGGGHTSDCARDHVLPGVCVSAAPELPEADDALREVAFAWPLLSAESRDLIVRCVRLRAFADVGTRPATVAGPPCPDCGDECLSWATHAARCGSTKICGAGNNGKGRS